MSLVQQLELGPCDLKLDSSTRGRLILRSELLQPIYSSRTPPLFSSSGRHVMLSRSFSIGIYRTDFTGPG